MTYDSITVMQTSPHVGAEIGNVDLTKPLSDTEVKEIRAAINAHGVIFFRDQEISHEDHDRFVRYFGDPHVHAGGKSTASVAVDGYPAIRKQYFDKNSPRISGETWHSDQSCAEIPPDYSILYQEIIPPHGGGNTMFLSATKAYETLSDSMKAYLEGKTATHTADKAYAAKLTKDNKETHLVVDHPMVITHPENGRKVLFVSPLFTSHINGVPEDESRHMLELLYEHTNRPNWMMRFNWTNHAIAMWDNRAVQHYAIWDYWPNERLGYRMFVKGTARPISSS